jgi:hypothetical protein
MNKFQAIRNVDPSLWAEAKAQAHLEGMSLSDWLQEAIKHAIRSDKSLRDKLTEDSICEMCGKAIHAHGEGQDRMIVHHDEPNNRSAIVAMCLCPRCHIQRHRQLGWGTALPFPEGPGFRPDAWKGAFKCRLCQRWFRKERLGKIVTRTKMHRPGRGRKPTIIYSLKFCLDCWTDRNEEVLHSLPHETVPAENQRYEGKFRPWRSTKRLTSQP